MSLPKKIIQGFIAGDETAVAEVFEEYKNLLYFIIATYVSNPSDCDDLLSETFLKALEHKTELRDLDKLRPFLCSIAKNEALSFLRKNAPMDSMVIEEMYGEEDKKNVLLNILEPLLSDKEAIVTYYRAVFSYSWKEIVEMTGIPESTARLLYRQAKEKLRKELA